MCGIVGAAGRRLQLTSEMVERMRDTLAHRGPDDVGAWLATDGNCALGHRRLAIIDLSPGGHQPMHDPKGELTIVPELGPHVPDPDLVRIALHGPHRRPLPRPDRPAEP